MFILKDGQQVRGVTLTDLKDADGNAAQIQGDPVWTSSDESLVTVSPDDAPDAAAGSQKVRTTEGPGLGDATVSATVDADLGDGVKSVTFSEVFRVIANDAVAGTIAVAGQPEDRT